ncbi:nuclear transcription factor Y subunit B-3-like [Rhodamnia argentea]|uniref:Nuclear transcription factor Y subunit B-3-like n=1 Tax=Rhodamnia argentea TaxID=178133 RepID=A0A8B8PJX9_9MYRT|nr:nuclear transcription factor Y subunit B-3-like [Rhodamnia argentea]
MTGKRSQTSPVGSPLSGNMSDGSSYSSKEQDRFLPIANVSRIMKRSLPANAKISKEAKETVQECVSEFISFVTGEASDKCQREKRKTINGDDLLWAMTTLGSENYVAPLKVYLNRHHEAEGDKGAAAAAGTGRGHENPPAPSGAEQRVNGVGDFQSFYGLVAAGGGFNVNRMMMGENGDGSGNKVMVPQIHNGVGR